MFPTTHSGFLHSANIFPPQRKYAPKQRSSPQTDSLHLSHASVSTRKVAFGGAVQPGPISETDKRTFLGIFSEFKTGDTEKLVLKINELLANNHPMAVRDWVKQEFGETHDNWMATNMLLGYCMAVQQPSIALAMMNDARMCHAKMNLGTFRSDPFHAELVARIEHFKLQMPGKTDPDEILRSKMGTVFHLYGAQQILANAPNPDTPVEQFGRKQTPKEMRLGVLHNLLEHIAENPEPLIEHLVVVFEDENIYQRLQADYDQLLNELVGKENKKWADKADLN